MRRGDVLLHRGGSEIDQEAYARGFEAASGNRTIPFLQDRTSIAVANLEVPGAG